jgi:PTS system cellobiose-specific IIB component
VVHLKKILLACNAGMSTSLLVQKMQAEVKAQGLDVEVAAYPLNQALDHIEGADILMLGPQIKYAKDDAVAAAGDVPVTVIDMADYGRMNAKKVLADAMAIIG